MYIYFEIMINLLKKNFRYFFIPMFIYRKLSKSKFLRKYLTKINLLNQNAYIGVYKNVKDLTTDLLKKKYLNQLLTTTINKTS